MTKDLPKHSKLGASSAKRWMACPGSIAMIAKAPKQPTSVYAAEGSAAHELAEICLLNDHEAKVYLGTFFNKKYDGTGFEANINMVEAVQVYLDVIREDAAEIGEPEMWIEEKFHLKDLHPDLFGTNDCSLADTMVCDILFIYDYKHGQGVVVEVEDNEQLMYYGKGAIEEYRKQGIEFDEIEIVVVQPRCSHEDGAVRRQRFTVGQIDAWSEELAVAALATESPNAELHAGDHCKFCPAAATCPALHERCNEIAKLEFDDNDKVSLTEPEHLSEADLVAVLDHAKMIDGWIKQVQGYAEGLALAGKPIPGYKLVRKKTNRKWNDEKVVGGALQRKFGKAKVYHPGKLLSIAQIEKEFGKKNPELQRIFNKYITKPVGDLVLAPNSDARKEVTQTPAELDFEEVEKLEEAEMDEQLFG